jgi:surfactin synthase thioesterase subunit
MPVTLICLPYAGAGASIFYPWRKLGHEHVVVTPLHLPGRERLIDEEPFTDLHRAADALLPQAVTEAGRHDRPVVLFGHSLGAVLAYELTRRLTESGTPVTGLVVSGSPAPWSPREQRATGLDDDQFLARVEEFAGYRHPAFDDPERRELLLPTLRADVEMHENYLPSSREPMAVDVTAVRGTDDDLVTARDLAAWAEVTTGSFRHVELAGGHMYLTESGQAVQDLVAGFSAAPSGRS